MTKIKVHIVWMDGMERNYEAASVRVWEGVLVLQDAKHVGEGGSYRPVKSIRFPVANIREWTDTDG